MQKKIDQIKKNPVSFGGGGGQQGRPQIGNPGQKRGEVNTINFKSIN